MLSTMVDTLVFFFQFACLFGRTKDGKPAAVCGMACSKTSSVNGDACGDGGESAAPIIDAAATCFDNSAYQFSQCGPSPCQSTSQQPPPSHSAPPPPPPSHSVPPPPPLPPSHSAPPPPTSEQVLAFKGKVYWMKKIL